MVFGRRVGSNQLGMTERHVGQYGLQPMTPSAALFDLHFKCDAIPVCVLSDSGMGKLLGRKTIHNFKNKAKYLFGAFGTKPHTQVRVTGRKKFALGCH